MSKDKLTERETQVMWLVAEGLSNKLIADRLGVSGHTAKFHVANACRKLDTSSRTRAAVNFILLQGSVAQQQLTLAATKAPLLLVA